MADDRLPRTRPRRTRAPGAYLALALWQRFALSLFVAVVLLAALVIFVNAHNTDSPTSQNLLTSPQANREAETLTAQDQAPHVARIAPGLTPAAALAHTLRAVMAARIAGGAVSGTIQRTTCRPSGPQIGRRRAFSCIVEVGDVNYPYLGVVDATAHRATYCKRDPPPVPSDLVPVSARCQP